MRSSENRPDNPGFRMSNVTHSNLNNNVREEINDLLHNFKNLNNLTPSQLENELNGNFVHKTSYITIITKIASVKLEYS